jgi:thioredoxin reductase (NADPH)
MGTYDVIILGGGPAGMSAAVWCADLGMKALLIERNARLGGQLLWTHNQITNYLGAEAKNGTELAANFAAQVERSGIEVVTGREVSSVDLAARSLFAGDEVMSAEALVIATGVRRRKLNIPGEEEFVGRGILTSGARDREMVRNKTVVIVGGGDAALENALILSDLAAKVVVVHRRDEFAARPEFVEAARQRANVDFIFQSTLTAISGGDAVEAVMIEDARGGCTTLASDAVLVRVGIEPSTRLFAGQIDLDERGYVVVDKELRTSEAGVWAIGDVTGPRAMTIANAGGAGSVAAKSIIATR